jgi:hypothetical protein
VKQRVKGLVAERDVLLTRIEIMEQGLQMLVSSLCGLC